MDVSLKPIVNTVDEALFQMVQEIGPAETGFENMLYSNDLAQFKQKLEISIDWSKGMNLPKHFVRTSTFWLYIDGSPVGYGKLRHKLNEQLLNNGGNISYVIRPKERGKGYGKLLLKLLLQEAKRHGLSNVLITVDVSNIPSRKVAEANQAICAKIENGMCKYWVMLD